MLYRAAWSWSEAEMMSQWTFKPYSLRNNNNFLKKNMLHAGLNWDWGGEKIHSTWHTSPAKVEVEEIEDSLTMERLRFNWKKNTSSRKLKWDIFFKSQEAIIVYQMTKAMQHKKDIDKLVLGSMWSKYIDLDMSRKIHSTCKYGLDCTWMHLQTMQANFSLQALDPQVLFSASAASVTSSDHQATGMADQNNRKPIWKVKVTNSCDLTPLR